MGQTLRQSELVERLDEHLVEPFLRIARRRTLQPGQYLFLLGQNADELSVIEKGRIELCSPLSLQGTLTDVTVESLGVGRTVGLSALVRPYRFIVSARAAGTTEVASFPRQDLLDFFHTNAQAGCAIVEKIAEVMGRRMLTFQALWARELQRAVDQSLHCESPLRSEERDNLAETD